MKKTFILLVILAISSSSLFAQNQQYFFRGAPSMQDNWQYYIAKYNSNYQGVSYLAYFSSPTTDKNLKSKEKLYFQYKKGVKQSKPVSRSIYTFNNGLLTDFVFLKKGKTKSHYAYEYNAHDYYTKFYMGPINTPKFVETLEYNDSNQVVKYTKYGKKHKFKKRTLSTYNADHKLVRKEHYTKISSEPKFVWDYKYNEKGKRIETEYYKNGKLISKWLFTCDDEGDKVKRKEEKLITTCSLVEHNNDGSYIKIFRNTNTKGHEQTSKWTYSKDSLLIAYEVRNRKDVIIRKYTQGYDDLGNRNLYIHYKKGGEKISHTYKYKFDANKNITERSIFDGKGKLKNRRTYHYNEDGNVTEYVEFNKKNEEKKKFIYSYNKDNELVSKVTYKKQVAKYERDYVYKY